MIAKVKKQLALFTKSVYQTDKAYVSGGSAVFRSYLFNILIGSLHRDELFLSLGKRGDNS